MRTQPTIRTETTEDIPEIHALVHAAFGQPGEADLVDALQRSGALTLSVVAVIDDRIVGHIAFSPLMIAGEPVALALAPMAVAPDCQRQGIGSALIHGHRRNAGSLGTKSSSLSANQPIIVASVSFPLRHLGSSAPSPCLA
ncbi:MAG TPA: N-acetyltransferase [Candidatus Binatia bacterium]|nr:N-acetyltransferase [Candidatus Binatia bacterium]